MKKILLAGLIVLLWAGFAWADRITLDSAETIDNPQAVALDWYVDRIDALNKTLTIKYRWIDANETPIRNRDSFQSWHTWQCRNIEVPGTNAECIAAGDPYECCTGAGTGTCDDMQDTCFSDVFGFNIRTQDVGTSIGIGLRALIWNQMKQDILTTGNDGSFTGE
jgi:hypothetical protein